MAVLKKIPQVVGVDSPVLDKTLSVLVYKKGFSYSGTIDFLKEHF